MTRTLAAAGLLASWLLVLPGCAGLLRPAADPNAPAPGAQVLRAPGTTDGSPAAVRVDIEAPAALKALLERHLDLVRLAQLARAEVVGDSELARLIDVAPEQVRELLATEGFFEPQVSIERSAAAAGEPERVRLRIEPGPPARIGRVELEVQGPLAQAAAAGDPAAQQLLAAWRQAWRLRSGAPFRNSDWSEAKAAALGLLRAAGYAAASWSPTPGRCFAAGRWWSTGCHATTDPRCSTCWRSRPASR